jgi:DNA gyrase subunit B
MFVGDVHDGSGLLHMVWELVGNSLDQHLAGRCTRIDVRLEADGSVVVADDGPGMPLTLPDGRPFIEVALTEFHARPTFDGHAPHEHVGSSLRGVGLFPLSALSSFLVVEVFRDGEWSRQRFEKGVAVTPLERVGTSERRGTQVTLLPDPAIFPDVWFDAGALAARLREFSYLLPELTLSFRDQREHVYREPRGLVALLDRWSRGESSVAGRLHVDAVVNEVQVEAAIQWLRLDSRIESYANIQRTTDGGTHVEGLVAGLVEALREASPKWKRRSSIRLREVVEDGLHAVVCVRLQDPSFYGPTKDRLMTPAVKESVSSAVQRAFVAFLERNPTSLAWWEQKR